MANITAAMVKELREMTGAAMMDCKKALGETSGDMDAAKEFLRKKGQATADKKSSRETNEGAVAVATGSNKAALIKVACETDFVAINDQFQDFISGIAEQALEVGAEGIMDKTSAKGSVKEQFVTAISKMGENMTVMEGASWDDPANTVTAAYTHAKGKIGVLVQLEASAAVDAAKQLAVAKDVAMHVAASHVEAISADDLDPAVVEKEKNFLTEQALESGKPKEIVEKMIIGRIKKFQQEICLLDQKFVKSPDQSIKQVLDAAGKELGANLTVKQYFKSSF